MKKKLIILIGLIILIPATISISEFKPRSWTWNTDFAIQIPDAQRGNNKTQLRTIRNKGWDKEEKENK